MIIMVGTVDMYKLHLLGVSENGLGADCKSQIRDCYANYTSLHFQSVNSQWPGSSEYPKA
jgi:hypothetical protein